MAPGRVIILNGTSSAGKTTLAGVLQAELETIGSCWVVYALDDFMGKLPFSYVRIGDHVGTRAEEGMAFEMIDGVIERRVGPVGTQVLAAYRGAVAAAARAGLNVIVDEVLLSEDDWSGWQSALDGLHPLWVRVDLDLATVEARERERGDRVVGMALAQYEVVHRFATYAITVDTGVMDPATAAATVMAVLGR